MLERFGDLLKPKQPRHLSSQEVEALSQYLLPTKKIRQTAGRNSVDTKNSILLQGVEAHITEAATKGKKAQPWKEMPGDLCRHLACLTSYYLGSLTSKIFQYPLLTAFSETTSDHEEILQQTVSHTFAQAQDKMLKEVRPLNGEGYQKGARSFPNKRGRKDIVMDLYHNPQGGNCIVVEYWKDPHPYLARFFPTSVRYKATYWEDGYFSVQVKKIARINHNNISYSYHELYPNQPSKINYATLGIVAEINHGIEELFLASRQKILRERRQKRATTDQIISTFMADEPFWEGKPSPVTSKVKELRRKSDAPYSDLIFRPSKTTPQ